MTQPTEPAAIAAAVAAMLSGVRTKSAANLDLALRQYARPGGEGVLTIYIPTDPTAPPDVEFATNPNTVDIGRILRR